MMDTISLILGILPIIWLAVNLCWAIFRGHGRDAAMYGAILLAAALVALNIGGALNSGTWKAVSIAVFALEATYRGWRGPHWKVPIALVLLFLAII